MICLLEAWPAHLGAAVHPPGCSPQTRVTWAVFSLVASAQGRGHTLSSAPGKRSRQGPAEGPLPRAEQGTLLSRLLLPPQLQPLASCLPGASRCTQHKAAFILASRALTGLPRNATCAPSVRGPPDCGAGAGLSGWLMHLLGQTGTGPPCCRSSHTEGRCGWLCRAAPSCTGHQRTGGGLRGSHRMPQGSPHPSAHTGTLSPPRPRGSDRVAGSSFSVVVDEHQLLRAATKVPDSGSCFRNGMF